MARIDGGLFARLKTKLGVSQRRVYQLVDEKVRETHLPRHLAAIALASERGINISRFATEDDLATIRQAATSAAPRPVVVPDNPSPSASSPRKKKKSRTASRGSDRRGTTVFVVHGDTMLLENRCSSCSARLVLNHWSGTRSLRKRSRALRTSGTFWKRRSVRPQLSSFFLLRTMTLS